MYIAVSVLLYSSLLIFQQGEMVADVKTFANASVLDNIRVVFGVALSR